MKKLVLLWLGILFMYPQVTQAQRPPDYSCNADINSDGVVEIADFGILSGQFFQTNPNNPRADINSDGIVDITDYGILAQHFFTQPSCTTTQGPGPTTSSIVTITPPSIKYQKAEWAFDLSKTYVNPYYYYDPTDTKDTNPSTMTWFGVDGVTVDMKLTSPSGKSITVPAFWMEDYTRVKDSNFSSLGNEVLGKKDNGKWHIRFTPSEAGVYQYYITAEDKTGVGRYPASGTQSFTVADSSKKGFIRTSSKDPRFFAYDNGQPYIPIGGGRQWWNDNVARSFDYEAAFTKFNQNGINLTRIWDQVDFALSIEGVGQPIWIDQNTVYGAAKGIEIGTNNVRSGLRAARPSVGQGWYQRISFTDLNKPHTLTVWIKTASIAGGVAQVNIKTGTGFNSGTLLGQTTGVTGTKDWTQYSFTFTPTSSVGSINLIQTAGTGSMYVDDLEVGPSDTQGKIAYNIASDANFERHFYKGNPNNDPDTTPTLARPIGTYMNPWGSYEMDKIVESAEANGVAIQACSCSGPWFTWPKNIAQTTDADWSAPWVLKSWQRNFRYRVARWGYSPAILGWELFNEMGHVHKTGSPNIWNFFVAFGNYQKSVDPYGHLRTNSQNSGAYSPGLWSSNAMDMANIHNYLDGHYPSIDNDETKFINQFAWCSRDIARGTSSPYCQGLGLGDGSTWTGAAKPWIWGELGAGSDGTQANTGEGGSRFLHNKTWAGLFSPFGVGALEWWWYQEDTTATNYKYASTKAASAFFANVDYDGGLFTYIPTNGDGVPGYTGESMNSSNTQVRAYGMRRADKRAMYLLVQNKSYVWSQSATALTAQSTNMTITNLLNQAYRVETWDTVTGQITNTQTVTPTSGSVTIPLTVTKDSAIKMELI